MRWTRVLILFSTALLYLTTASTQLYVGVRAGLASNRLVADLSNLHFVDNRRGQGYNTAIDVLYSPFGRIFLRTGLMVCQKNYSLSRTGPFTGAYTDHKNTYLQLPLSLQWQVPVRRFSLYFNAGAYGAWWTSARVKGNTPNILDLSTDGQGNSYFNPATYDNAYDFDPRRDNRLEYGWLAGAGLGYKYKPGLLVVASIDYSRSCSDMQKNYTINQTAKYNETYFFSLGCQLSRSNRSRHRRL
jgi:hypothetical protein